MRASTRRNYRLVTAGACLGAVLGGAAKLQAQAVSTTPTPSEADKISQLEKQNQELQKRLGTLENLAQKGGLLPSGTPNADPPVSAMSDFGISGFVTTSYFHDSTEPPASVGHVSPGYLWNRVNDNLSINKVKLTFASPPVQHGGDKFDVAYRVSLIAGQDAPIVDSKSGINGFEWLREAYLEMNVPIGTGLDIKAGELISLLNYESGDGGAANDNFSQGFQWFFTGNGPAESIELGYDITDKVGVKFRIQNGLYAGPIDNNSSKTFVAAVDLKPFKDLWVNVLAFGGREDAFSQSVLGGELLAGWTATSQLSFGTELDYFDFYNHAGVVPVGNNSVWSGGLWTTYNFTSQVGLALRAEYLSDTHGADISGGALGFENPPGIGQDLTSFALTLNYKPSPRIKLQPEIRYDHTTFAGGFVNGKNNRFIFGAGASYLF
jgi:hypothetical protein